MSDFLSLQDLFFGGLYTSAIVLFAFFLALVLVGLTFSVLRVVEALRQRRKRRRHQSTRERTRRLMKAYGASDLVANRVAERRAR